MKILYHTMFNDIPLFEINDLYIAKLRMAAFIPDDEPAEVAEKEIYDQFLNFLKKMAGKPLDLYEDVVDVISRIEQREQMTIDVYFEKCIKKLSELQWKHSFQYVPQLEDLVNDDWLKKLRVEEDDDDKINLTDLLASEDALK